MNWYQVTNDIVNWLRDKVNEANLNGLIVALSGGIDSAVVGALCKKAFPDNTMGVILPCKSHYEDQQDAELIADTFKIFYKKVELDDIYDLFLDKLDSEKDNDLSAANIKPRLRMISLYYYAQKNNYLVAGTGNKSEILTGYFTKYGDGGVDIEPIGHLFKTQVYELAQYLEIPQKIINRPPTAGLWKDQNDENELGITYKQLDKYLKDGEAEPEVKELVDNLVRKSRHKRQMPPVPSL